MFIVKNEEMVPVAKTLAFMHPRHPFTGWVTCGKKIARNHPNHEFWTYSMEWAWSLRKTKKWFQLQKLVL
jgi:hypothetical protein